MKPEHIRKQKELWERLNKEEITVEEFNEGILEMLNELNIPEFIKREIRKRGIPLV